MDFFSRGSRRSYGAFLGVCWLLLFEFGLFKSKERGLMAAGWSCLCVGLAVCISYDFLGLRTQRKVLFFSQLREDPDFGTSSVSSAVRI